MDDKEVRQTVPSPWKKEGRFLRLEKPQKNDAKMGNDLIRGTKDKGTPLLP